MANNLQHLVNLLQQNIQNYRLNPGEYSLGPARTISINNHIASALADIQNGNIYNEDVLYDTILFLGDIIYSPALRDFANLGPIAQVAIGASRKGSRKVGGNEELRNAIRNKLHSVEHLVQHHNLAEFTHILNLVNNPNQNISMGLWYDTIDLIRKIMLPYRRVRRQGGNRVIGAGIFDLISPIANMFSGTSFNTPLDSIIPREVSTQIASNIADEGLGGGRKIPSKNPWIAHVKSVANKNGISYNEALKIASKTYKK